MGKARIILHIDMNSFYASVEQMHDPSLKGKPVAVAGNVKERRGIIITCSYEARAFGVKTTMTVGEARRLCKDIVLLTPNFERYREASFAFFSLLRTYSPLLEPVSIDEGYLDITDYLHGKHPLVLVEEIQRRILHELHLPCSIGVGPNKFLAKTASDMKKPLGITVLRKRDVKEVLWPRDVVEMHGIGEKTAKKLRNYGIHTIGELAHANSHELRQLFGVNGERMHQKANGIDAREVDPDAIYDTKSVGNSTTLPRDETEYYVLKQTFETLSQKVADRLQAKGLVGTTVIVYMKDHTWQTRTRSKSVQNALNKQVDIFKIAWDMFLQHWDETPLRLIGVTVSNVTDERDATEQLNLFNFQQYEKEEPIIEVLHKLEKQFGEGIVQRGIRIKKKTNHHANTSFSKDFLDDFSLKDQVDE